ncbi:hypothetical protein ACFL0D_04125 [Thermoproteota archaeon]
MYKAKNSSHKEPNPIKMLDDIENVDLLLNENELILINAFYNSLESFNQITEDLEYAYSVNKFNEREIKNLFELILKVMKYKNKTKETDVTSRKKSLVRTFFELPEIISKKIYYIRSK